MTTHREIIAELDSNTLKLIISNIDIKDCNILIVKFTATWCRPCQTIKKLCNECFTNLPKNVIISEVDVDENMELYMFMKKKRIVSGIPAILVWYPTTSRDANLWYIPNDSISGSSTPDIYALFKRCNTKATGI